MPETDPNLGVCFSGKRLLYAVAKPDSASELLQIGCIDYSFDVIEAFKGQDPDLLPGITNAIVRLKDEYGIYGIRMLTMPEKECWTVFPKTVYEEQEDREAHLEAITFGMKEKTAEPHWYTVSNRDYKMVSLRSQDYVSQLDQLTQKIPRVQYFSDFEIGTHWITHSKSAGSFLTVSCHKNLISITSFILGKLRAATYIAFSDINDLPYFWLQNANNLSWLNGLYDQIFLYGFESYKVLEQLKPFWEANAEILNMDSLDKMLVKANDETYSFELEEAFPAIMLALGNETKD